MKTYPPGLPCVSRVEGLSSTGFAAVLRTLMTAGNARQRRSHGALPHSIQLQWVIEQPRLLAFVTWCNANAWRDFVAIPLPGFLASRAGTNGAPTPVRFVSDLAQALVPGEGLWVWRVSVEAEWHPTPADLGLLAVSA